ncbi:MAG: M20 aminoacylase family protein [Verrucomicrobiia bacterium]|tara:strand:- start:8516 stop:9688 length:1173 start_codon:yes stop_codon:yes gene_type:complete
MPITPRLQELQPEIASWRQDIHQNPEILFDTHRTSGLVADKLKEFGCDSIKTGIGRTGVVGVIKGRQNTSGKVIGIRADMDALPIFEDTGLSYASSTPGKMHACGHDGHTSMLLGATKYLAETRNFDGTAVVIYQPAEEGGGGGGEMCADGMMDEFGIQEVYGMHNMPGIPIGQFAIREGSFFAATDEFTIDVTGLGGHAAKPHESIDTTVVAAQIVIALQTVASRNSDPLKALVVSVTSFRTESEAYNVIPERVQLRGTVRTMDKDIRELAEKRIKEVCQHTAAAYGATTAINYHKGYPVMVNAPAQTAFAAEVAAQVAGAENVTTDTPAIMGGEDFAFMLEERPGAYILVGNGDTAMVHHPKYDFNDNAIPAGSSFWVQLIEKAMPLA